MENNKLHMYGHDTAGVGSLLSSQTKRSLRKRARFWVVVVGKHKRHAAVGPSRRCTEACVRFVSSDEGSEAHLIVAFTALPVNHQSFATALFALTLLRARVALWQRVQLNPYRYRGYERRAFAMLTTYGRPRIPASTHSSLFLSLRAWPCLAFLPPPAPPPVY